MKGWKSIPPEDLSAGTQRVYDVLNDESDLACVLIGTSYLSELLASALKGRFVETSISDKLLNPLSGALGNFAPRAQLARCLGLINKEAYQDLIQIAEMRNRFAHSHLALTFRDAGVRQLCQDLKSWRILASGEEMSVEGATEEQLGTLARNQFNYSVVLLGTRLNLTALSPKAPTEPPASKLAGVVSA